MLPWFTGWKLRNPPDVKRRGGRFDLEVDVSEDPAATTTHLIPQSRWTPASPTMTRVDLLNQYVNPLVRRSCSGEPGVRARPDPRPMSTSAAPSSSTNPHLT